MTPAEVISISRGRGAGSAIGGLGDRRLVRLAKKGDPRAFAAIYERHHQDIFRYCQSITGNAEDASDALQSTMAAALRALPREQREVTLRPWLFRIAHNESVSILRRRTPFVELTESVEPSTPGPYAVASMRERLSGLVSDLQALPERQRGALVMRELIGLEYDEIAAALNVTGGAARQAVYEARLALSQSDEGRDMACEAARRSISSRDGRTLRGRRLRAHLRGCRGCTAFSEQLGARRAALPAILPPLPAAAGAAILGGLMSGAACVGGGAAGTAATGGFMSIIAGSVSQAAGAGAASKGVVAAVAVAVVAGVGTVEVTKKPDQSPPPATQRSDASPRQSVAQAALPVVRTAAAPRRRRRPARPVDTGALKPRAPVAESPRVHSPRRTPRKLQVPRSPDIEPVSDPTPTPAPPAPAPAPAPASEPAPVPTAPAVRYPWQEQYTQSMQQAQLGLQVGQQVYQQAIQLTQQVVNGIFPIAPR